MILRRGDAMTCVATLPNSTEWSGSRGSPRSPPTGRAGSFAMWGRRSGFPKRRLASSPSGSPDRLEAALESRPELRASAINRDRFRWVFALAERLMDIPTGVGLHSAGVIVGGAPLEETVPVMWSASPGVTGSADPHLRMIQWDKRSAKHVFDKFDILCLRGQDVLGGTETSLGASGGALQATRDPEVYRAMRSGELIGIPQSASPAMRQAHQRLRTENLDDASLVQAGIRPGVGGAVKINELIARRRGKPYTLEHPDLAAILGNTYGVIVFQEQVDQLLQTFCRYTSGEAEDIRDGIYKRRKESFAATVREQIITRALAAGYSPSVAETVYELVSQFSGYGFSQGHALSFAEVSLRAVWFMQNHPAEYFAALLSAQPSGYYGPCTIANEARSRGVAILRPDVNLSRERFVVEGVREEASGLLVPGGGIRTGWMQLGGLSAPVRERLIA
ncbi:MAG: hypothetical protein C4320_09775, partial [Armatimonadota bacterium]